MTSYTINRIQEEMTADGSHWWDKDTMRAFGTRVSDKVYQGESGVFFVTSEKPPHGERAFSVRQYQPEAKNVDTVGDFCVMTRSQAHAKAAELAGPSATIVQEAHREVSTVDQFVIDIQRGGGRASATSAAFLIRLATRHHKMMEDDCNYGNMHDENGEPVEELSVLMGKIVEDAKECHCGVKFSGDPRGATVKLILPNGDTNDWGKDGWCVPTRD